MLERLRNYLELVKFQHTVFALPFALAAALVSARGELRARQLGWILLAMVGARTAAMGFNRIVDRDLDRLNPRTAAREIPAGKVSVAQAAALVLGSVLMFELAAWSLNPLAFALSGPVLLVLFGYSFCKRFTSLAHFVLGFALGLAPIGAWVAVRGTIEPPALWLGAAVMFWVAGFDIIYATLDRDFDERMNLHSLVRRLGLGGALQVARGCHLLFVLLLLAFGGSARLGVPFHAGVALIALALAVEHRLVSPRDLGRVNLAFFTLNGAISVAVFLGVALDLWGRRT